MAQIKSSTAFNRTPGIFVTAQEWARRKFSPTMKGGALRILSFGCADGSEMASLRCYFPSACIFGCDVVTEPINASRHGKRAGIFFVSTPESIAEHGSYDMIFAMSVLCVNPMKGPITEEFPFDLYCELLEQLKEALKPGGLLVVFNANYLFKDYPGHRAFRPVRSPMVASNGWIPKFLPNGRQLTTSKKADDISYNCDLTMDVTHLETIGLTESDLRDCMFERTAGEPRHLSIGEPRPEATLEPVGSRTMGLERSALVEELYVAPDGEHWIRREWQVADIQGDITSLGEWWERGSLDLVRPGAPSVLGVTRSRSVFRFA